MFDITRNGKSDGITVLRQSSIPSATPEEAVSGYSKIRYAMTKIINADGKNDK